MKDIVVLKIKDRSCMLFIKSDLKEVSGGPRHLAYPLVKRMKEPNAC